MPGNIKSVTVYILTNAASKTTYHCAFSTTECTSAYTTGSTAVNITGGKSNKYTCTLSNAKYFCISLGNENNGQVYKLDVEYETAAPTTYTVTLNPNYPEGKTGVFKDKSNKTINGNLVLSYPSGTASMQITSLYNSLTLDGYDFGGWYNAMGINPGDVSGSPCTNTGNITGDKTYYAKWTQKAYTVTATSNNNNYGTVSVSGTTITASPKTGYTYANPAYTVTSGTAIVTQNGNTFTVTPSTNCTIRINFEAKPKYTVTLVPGSGSCLTTSLQETSAGAGVPLPTANPPATCATDDWTFAGWTTGSVSETTTTPDPLYAAGSSYKPTSNITLYAVYSKEETTQGGGTEVTITPSGLSDNKVTHDQSTYTITTAKNTGQTEPAYVDNGADIRICAKGSITISNTTNITKIVFNVSTQGKTRLAPITASVGSIATQASGDETVTWIGEAKFVTFIVGDKAEYGSDGNTKAGQLCFTTITATTSGGGSTTTTYYHSNPECGPQKLATPNVELTYDCSSATITWDAVTNAKAYWYQIIKTGDDNSGESSTKTTYTRNNIELGVSYTWSVKAIGDGSKLSDSEIATGTFTAYSIQWLANGELIENACGKAGEEIVVPSNNPASCDDSKEFVGWTATPIDGSIDTEPNDLFTESPDNITGNATYYAVFATAAGSGMEMDATLSFASEAQRTSLTDDKAVWQQNNITLTNTKGNEQNAANCTTYVNPVRFYKYSKIKVEHTSSYIKKIVFACNTAQYAQTLNTSIVENYAGANIKCSDKEVMIEFDSPVDAFEVKLSDQVRLDQLTVTYTTGSGTSYSDYTTTCDANKAKVTYDLNGGEYESDDCVSQMVTKGQPFNLCSNTPTKEGYTFAGWSDGTKIYAADSQTTVSESTTFYAAWTAKTITITWDQNYTDCHASETSTYIYDGEDIEMPEDPIRTGYKFNGWYTKANDGTEVTEVGDENKPSADVTYYAQWEKLHTVTFIASGQVYVKQEHKYISGDKLVLPEIDPSAANFACDGYLFEGWSKYQQTKEDANCPELVDASTLVENDLELHAVWKKASTSGAGTQIFYESFDTEKGTGGNDGKWSGDIAKSNKVNTTWTFENEGGAYQCIKLGSSSKKGSATTPALTQLSGDATLSFKAAAWNGNSESTTLKLTISGGGTLTLTSVTLVKGAWTTYEAQITDGTPSSTITFAAANTSNNRFFLDEVKITTSGSYNYTTSPSCGPTMVAKENVWATSATGQSVKVNVPLGIKQFEGAATIIGTSTNENFVVNTLENAGNGEHQVVVVYTPTADDTKENTTITLTAKVGEETISTTTFTLNGRSLPNEFVVVANKGDKNYALPANMAQANVYAGLVVEVSGEEVIAAPKTHLYTARAVHSTRFAENGTALRLVGNDDACLWASNAVSGTSIRNWAKLENANTANYEWYLYTEDGDTYYISSTAVTEEGRVLRLDGTNFGMYKQGVDAFRLLPVGCTSTPMNVKTSATRTSATISWTNASECNVVVKQGSTTVQSISAAASPLVVGNLAESTTYTFTLTPTDDASCGTEGSFTTTGPTIDIVEWQTGGIRIYVDKDENVNPKVIINGEEEHGNVGGQVATELFFSKYYEAHAENKLLAVYNGTTQTIDLNGYVIKHGTVEIDLSQYGKTKGFIAPNEEIIFVSFDTDDNKSAESCAEKEEGFRSWNVLETNLLAFSGRGSVGLYKNDVLIDLIGSTYPSGELTKIGKSDKCGTGSDVRLHVDELSVNDQSSFFCYNGDNHKTTEVETDYQISTNRCLLIRKNTVTSGANAVASNKAKADATCGDLSSTFTTLCSEWSGFRIGGGSSSNAEIQKATCEGLGYVGGFDYNNYYRTMENIYTGKTLNEYDKNDQDNTYFIEFDDISDYSCLNIQLQLTDNDGNVLADQISQVPILVEGEKTTTNELFSAIVKNGEDPDYENSKIRCATCDVVILDGGILTKAAPDTENDVNQVRDIYIYPGGKLVVPANATDYSVNNVSLRRVQDEVAAADIQAPLNITSSSKAPIFVDMRIDANNWHWFALPYDCNIADVTWVDGSKAAYNIDWFLMYYDGESRAASTNPHDNHWKVYEGTKIEAGKGYIVGITGDVSKPTVKFELRFPMAQDVLTAEQTRKTVPVNAWGVKSDNKPNNLGWNLVGNPYLNYYQPMTTGFSGLPLIKYTGIDPVTGDRLYDNSGNVPYLVTPIDGGWYEYRQELASEVNMMPFTAYFVQVGDPNTHENGQDLNASFEASNRGKKSIVRRAPAEIEETEEPIIVRVELTNSKGESDKTSLVIDDRFTNEYEMNADFFKWFGDYYNYYTKPVLYTIGADQGKRAFNALNEELAAQPIPMGMYAAQAGNYTFSLNQQFDLSRVEEVWLYDATQSTYTNLMQSDYTFSTSKVNGAGRFSLSVKLAPKVATSIDNLTADKVWATTHTKQVIVNGLENGMHLWLYDATGKLLYNEPTSNYQHTYSVPQTGTYFVSVMNGNQKQTIKVVVE